LVKEFPLQFAPFGFVTFQPFKYVEDGSDCIKIVKHRNLRADQYNGIDNDAIDTIKYPFGLEQKCLGFQGLYRKAIHCEMNDVKISASFGSYNDNGVNFLPRMGNENITCHRTDIFNCGTNFLKFLKTILFEEEDSLCNFMSSAIEDQKALLYQIHANYENFSRFCNFFVEKLVLMLEDEFLRKYVSEMLMEFGSVPPIFITAFF